MHNIGFPNLFSKVFTINPTAFTLFGKEIRWYGLIICLGMILAFLYALTRAKKENISTDDLLDFVIITIPCAVIGARLYFVLTTLNVYDYDSFIDVIAIWNGGIAIYGAIIAGFISILAVSLVKKISFAKILDVFAPALAIGQAIGRWGNFANAEAYGSLATLDLLGKNINLGLAQDFPLVMTISEAGSQYVQYVMPTFLLESVWNVLCFLTIAILYKHKRFDGQMALTYFAFYGFGRFFIEGLRQDSLYIGSFRISQLVALVTFIAAITLLVVFTVKSSGKQSNEYTNQFAEKEIINTEKEEENG